MDPSSPLMSGTATAKTGAKKPIKIEERGCENELIESGKEGMVKHKIICIFL